MALRHEPPLASPIILQQPYEHRSPDDDDQHHHDDMTTNTSIWQTLINTSAANPSAHRLSDMATLQLKTCNIADVALVQRLLAQGADPNVRDAYRLATPLLRACQQPPQLQPPSPHTAVPFLNENITCPVLRVMRLLLQAGADASAADIHGMTPLAAICQRKQHGNRYLTETTAVRWLLEHGADPNSCDVHWTTPLMHALSPSSSSQAPWKNSPYDADLFFPSLTLSSSAYQHENSEDHDSTKSSSSSNSNTEEIVHMLLQAGAKVNVRNAYGVTPLHLACQSRQVGAVQALLQAGANVNDCHTGTDITPLHLACRQGAAQEQPPDHHHHCQHPLLLPCKNEKDENSQVIAIVDLLLRAGANVNALDIWDMTPLHAACRWSRPSLLPLLVQRLLQVNHNNLVDAVEPPLVSSVNVSTVDCLTGATPLLTACERNCSTTVQLLLESGANPNQANRHDLTPLFVATDRNNVDMVSHLIAHGAHVRPTVTTAHSSPACTTSTTTTTTTTDGFTPLLLGIAQGHVGVVQVLLEHGAATPATTTTASPLANNNHATVENSNDHDPEMGMESPDWMTPWVVAVCTQQLDMIYLLVRNSPHVWCR